MTFDAYELSLSQGEPVVLYEFNRGGAITRYTSADRNIVIADNTYKSIPISDGGITQSGDESQDTITITVISTEDVPAMFIQTPPSQILYVMIKYYHADDPDVQVVTQWIGTVSDVQINQIGTATISCRTITASFDHDGGDLTWGRSCNHILYQPGCFVDPADFETDIVISAVTTTGIVSAGFTRWAAPRFAGGYVQWTNTDGSIETRGIVTHAGNAVGIIGFTNGLSAGMTIQGFPGCNLTPDDCRFFANLPNFGGYDSMPGRSPFDGNPVF